MSYSSPIHALKTKYNRTKLALLYDYNKKKYLQPKYKNSNNFITSKIAPKLMELRDNGITKFEKKYEEYANYINNYYVPYLEKQENHFEHSRYLVNTQSISELERPFNSDFLLNEPFLRKLFFDKDLMSLLKGYFMRQPFIRNNPVISRVNYTGKGLSPADKFHLDGGLHQISFMMLLNDISENDSHMEYALKTNNQLLNRRNFLERHPANSSYIRDKYNIFKLTGKAGDLFVFDAGNGFHRANLIPGTSRTVLHMNITTGYGIIESSFNKKEDFSDYELEFLKKPLLS